MEISAHCQQILGQETYCSLISVFGNLCSLPTALWTQYRRVTAHFTLCLQISAHCSQMCGHSIEELLVKDLTDLCTSSLRSTNHDTQANLLSEGSTVGPSQLTEDTVRQLLTAAQLLTKGLPYHYHWPGLGQAAGLGKSVTLMVEVQNYTSKQKMSYLLCFCPSILPFQTGLQISASSPLDEVPKHFRFHQHPTVSSHDKPSLCRVSADCEAIPMSSKLLRALMNKDLRKHQIPYTAC